MSIHSILSLTRLQKFLQRVTASAFHHADCNRGMRIVIVRSWHE